MKEGTTNCEEKCKFTIHDTYLKERVGIRVQNKRMNKGKKARLAKENWIIRISDILDENVKLSIQRLCEK